MKRGAIECCHYTNKDCSRNQRDDDGIIFRVSFTIHLSFLFIFVKHIDTVIQLYLFFVDGNGDVRIAKCTTGGTLIIRGTKDYYHGECIDATGVSNTFLLPKEDV